MAGRPFRFAITRADFKAALSALKEFFRYCAGFRTPARQGSPRAEAAGVRKAPRHEIAEGGAPVGAAGAMGIWAGRACHGDWLAAVRVVASGQRIFVASTLNARTERCARGLGWGWGSDLARRCK